MATFVRLLSYYHLVKLNEATGNNSKTTSHQSSHVTYPYMDDMKGITCDVELRDHSLFIEGPSCMTTPEVMEPTLIKAGNLFSHQIIFAYLIPGICDSDAADGGYDGDVICTLNHHQSFPYPSNNNDTH